MNVENLQLLRTRLIAFAKGDNPKRLIFNMQRWAFAIDDEGMPACGTVACAIGLAATISEFRNQGFRLVEAGLNDPCPVFTDPVAGEISDNFDAVADLFQISRESARLLFDPHYYLIPSHLVTPAVVAERISLLIALRDTPSKFLKFCLHR